MAHSPPQRQQFAAWLRDLFDWDLTKLLLSVIIILSVLPFPWVNILSMVFFGFFAVELSGRIWLFREDLRQRSLNKAELFFLILDILATLSFLPIEYLWDEARYLRLMRLSRMMLLLGYWGPIVREIWFIVMKRERRYQIFFVIASVLILTFVSAILLSHFQTLGIDLNEDGNLDNDSSFWVLLWWSFRQIQDPGNILKSADATMAFFFSVFLTIAGMFIFSFLIGIGASVVEELVALGKERRLGMHRHSVICNVGDFSRVLLEELVTYYAKSFRSPRIVAMGPRASRYGYMLEGPAQRVRYRQGRPISVHDLKRVDADRATRVILLGQPDNEQSDAQVVSQILSVRQVNPACDIYAELHRPDNVRAALTAGAVLPPPDQPDLPLDERRTVPILVDHLVGRFLANITMFPGVQDLYWELLTSQGDEIYTCLFGYGALESWEPPSAHLLPFSDLLARAQAEHGVILLGYLTRSASDPLGATHALNPGSARGGVPGPPQVAPVKELNGFFGVADNFHSMRKFVESLPDVSAAPPDPPLELLPAMGQCPAAPEISRILICGFHAGLDDYCEQLILFAGEPEFFILLPDEKALQDAMRVFTHRMEEEEEDPLTPRRVAHFKADGPASLRYTVIDQGERKGEGKVHLAVADWTDEDILLDPPDLDISLEQADVIFFSYVPGDPDPDARTALGLLKLVRLQQEQAFTPRPGHRVVCEVQSSEKAMLFASRFGQPAPGQNQRCLPVAIVPAEKLRNAILAQSVFVPGISAIYRELLSDTGQEICKLLMNEPEEPEARWDFTRLLHTLHQRDGLLLLAVELQGPDDLHPRVVVNPGRKDPDYRFRAGHVRGVYAIGDKGTLSVASERCEDCGM